jgi:hypothetical protein
MFVGLTHNSIGELSYVYSKPFFESFTSMKLEAVIKDNASIAVVSSNTFNPFNEQVDDFLVCSPYTTTLESVYDPNFANTIIGEYYFDACINDGTPKYLLFIVEFNGAALVSGITLYSGVIITERCD